jgi:hypothetical protein
MINELIYKKDPIPDKASADKASAEWGILCRMPIVGNDGSHHDTWSIQPGSMLLRLSDHPSVLACDGPG